MPSGEAANKNLELYTSAMETVAKQNGVPFINVFEVSKEWYTKKKPLTIDGLQLNEDGYAF